MNRFTTIVMFVGSGLTRSCPTQQEDNDFMNALEAGVESGTGHWVSGLQAVSYPTPLAHLVPRQPHTWLEISSKAKGAPPASLHVEEFNRIRVR